jgi:polyferredoxin
MTALKIKRRSGWLVDRVARKLVQVGFLVLFLFPLFPIIFKRITFQPAVTYSSWLLPFDPLLFIGQVIRQDWQVLVIGAPLLLLALSLFFGRAFCGWVCPMGTVLDAVRSIAFWQKGRRKRPVQNKAGAKRNSHARYYLLIGVVAGGFLSLQFLGILDPLVIFHRTATTLTTDIFALKQPPVRILLSVVSLVFVALVVLELWRPRFWCRNLCPMGALFSLVSRWSLLNRRVNTSCTGCAQCSRACPMNAIPAEAHDTDYSDCIFCLECESECPRGGVTFGFGSLALRSWQKKPRVEAEPSAARFDGSYSKTRKTVWAKGLTRRQFTGGVAAACAGIALEPLVNLNRSGKVIRPPGAASEDEFLDTCIVCQECVRVCPTGGIRPVFLETGLRGIGTPQMVPRQGGCALNPSCPNLCAQVCPVGALKPTRPEDLKLGLAYVDRTMCLAWDQGVKCLVCVEACLVNAAVAYQGRVTVDPLKCTGCGRCETGCPVAGSAIRVYPF